MSQIDEGSCDEEEKYQPIFEEEEELEDSVENPRPKHEYNTPTMPHTSPEVRSRNLSPSRPVNTNSTNDVNSGQGSPGS